MSPTEADEAEESRAVLGHIAGFLLPIVAPLALLIASRHCSGFIHRHLLASTVVSGLWLMLAVGVISIDVGRFSVDEQQTSTAGCIALVVVGASVFLVNVLNMQRAKRRQSPIGWPTYA